MIPPRDAEASRAGAQWAPMEVHRKREKRKNGWDRNALAARPWLRKPTTNIVG